MARLGQPGFLSRLVDAVAYRNQQPCFPAHKRGGGAGCHPPCCDCFLSAVCSFLKKQNPKQKMTKQAEVFSRWPQARQPSPGSVDPGLVCGIWCCTGLDEVTKLSSVKSGPIPYGPSRPCCQSSCWHPVHFILPPNQPSFYFCLY